MPSVEGQSERRVVEVLKRVAIFTAGFVAAPFLQTGIYRVTPYFGELWFLVPLVVLGIASVVMWKKGLKTLATGLATGTICMQIFLAWLIYDLGKGFENFD